MISRAGTMEAVKTEAVAGILLQGGVAKTVTTGQDEDQEADLEEELDVISGVRTRLINNTTKEVM